jgi:mannose-6-phosphate isomerase-like protein (cupin superfamily)
MNLRSGWLVLFGCVGLISPAARAHEGDHPPPPLRTLPAKSYEHQPEKPPTPDDYVIRLEQMGAFYDVPGEFGHALVGKDHGFKQLSFIITDTQPNGGPPLHTHDTEEAHVLIEGTAKYWVVDPATKKKRTFTATAPYVARIPAGFHHTFINAGPKPFRLIAVFPHEKPTYTEVGPNPLVPPPAAEPKK